MINLANDLSYISDRAFANMSYDRHLSIFNLLCAAANLGETEVCLDCLHEKEIEWLTTNGFKVYERSTGWRIKW